jgi:AcrR family transcriptional regulator
MTTMPEINVLVDPDQLDGMSRRARKKQETRWRIFDAAMELFAKQGYDEVKIEDICEAADVSNALFFHHFSNKAALIRAYMDRLKAEIAEKLESAPDATSTEKLEIISREVVRSSRDTAAFAPQLFGALTSGDRKLDMEHLDTGITGTLTQIIRDGQENGEFSADWHPELVAVSLVSAWIIMPMAMKSPSFPDHPHAELLDLMLAGMSAER